MNKLAAVGLLGLSAIAGWGIPSSVAQDERVGQQEHGAEAAVLVEQLGAEEFSLRERATTRLIDLGVDVKPRLKTLKVTEPAKRSAGIKVPDVATLVAKLKTEAKVI